MQLEIPLTTCIHNFKANKAVQGNWLQVLEFNPIPFSTHITIIKINTVVSELIFHK